MDYDASRLMKKDVGYYLCGAIPIASLFRLSEHLGDIGQQMAAVPWNRICHVAAL